MTPERILFLYLATGGGHSSAAKALSREVTRIAGDGAECFVFNPLGDKPSLNKRVIEEGYTVVSTRYPWLWPILYNISHFGPMMRFQTDVMRISTTDPIADIVREKGITRIVILHFLLIRPVRSALKRLGKTAIPTLTIITDPFTTHNLWSYKQHSPVAVFSQEARRRVERRLKRYAENRADPPRISVCPPILDIKFAQGLDRTSRDRIRDEQGFSKDKPLILLAGGGEGLPAGERYLKALVSSGLDIQIAMVCGKNETQFAAAQAIAENAGNGVRVRIYGFVSIMYELMNTADIVVTKAGPATVFEVLSLKKPLVLTRYLYGQEQGNVDFVLRKGLGWYEPKPAGLVERLRILLDRPEAFDEVRTRLEKTTIGIGTEEIAKQVLGKSS